VTGRWDQPDWINELGGQANLYAYCGNSPTNATDPMGTNVAQDVVDKLDALFGIPADLINKGIAGAVNAAVNAQIAADIRAGRTPSLANLKPVSIPVGSILGLPATATVQVEGTVTLESPGVYSVHWHIKTSLSLSKVGVDVKSAISSILSTPENLLQGVQAGAKLLADKMKHPIAGSGKMEDGTVKGDMTLSVSAGGTKLAHLDMHSETGKPLKQNWQLDVTPSQVWNAVKDAVKLPDFPGDLKKLSPADLADRLKKLKFDVNLPVSAEYGIDVTYDGTYKSP
jgi:hypothetical protein